MGDQLLMSTTIEVVLVVEVTDAEELRLAAEAAAIRKGIPIHDWMNMREGIEDDLSLVFNPDAPVPGARLDHIYIKESS